jgi:phage anti-repressor protein
MLNILEKNGEKYISLLEMYMGLGLAKAAYSKWVKTNLIPYYSEGSDYIIGDTAYVNIVSLSDRKRGIRSNTQEYLLTIATAKEVAMMARTDKSKDYRKWLLSLESSVESGDLMTAEEAVMAMELIRVFTYLENQRKAFELHQKKYISSIVSATTNPYVAFEAYRSELLGYDKNMIEVWVEQYCDQKYEHPKNVVAQADLNKKPRYKKIAIANPKEAIKAAIIDFVYGSGNEGDYKERGMRIVSNLLNASKVEVKTDAPIFGETVPVSDKISLDKSLNPTNQ